MALKGKLRDFRLTQLLNLVHLARKTGALSIDSTEGRADLYFREGKLVYASLAETPSTLADVMVRAGKLTQGQANQLQSSRVRDDKQLGLLLINSGKVSKNELLQILRKNMQDVVHTVFQWGDGAFIFDQKLTPPAGQIAIPVSLDSIILEGSQRQEEQVELQDELPSLDVILKFTDGPGSNLRNINLSVDEWRVISFINPRNTIANIARFNQMSEFQVRKIVAKLLRDELVEIVGSPSRRSPASPSRAGANQASSAQSQRAGTPVIPSSDSEVAEPTYSKPEVGKGIIRRLIDRIKGL